MSVSAEAEGDSLRGHYILVCSSDSIGIYIPKSKAIFIGNKNYEQKIVTIDVENMLLLKKLVIAGADIVLI